MTSDELQAAIQFAKDRTGLWTHDEEDDAQLSKQFARALLALAAENERMRAEDIALKLRPPMACYHCENHNEQLVRRIEAMNAAVCPTCTASPAFVASQQWPLPAPPPMTEEEEAAFYEAVDALRATDGAT